MDELIGQLATKAGIDEAVAEKTIGIILGFLRNEGPSDKVQALIDRIPGAEAAIAGSSSTSGLADAGAARIGSIQAPSCSANTCDLTRPKSTRSRPPRVRGWSQAGDWSRKCAKFSIGPLG